MDILSFKTVEILTPVGSRLRTRLDFIINGVSLTSILGHSAVGKISSFEADDRSDRHIQTKRTLALLSGECLHAGRFYFYVCSHCEDVGCGVLSGTFKDDGSTVVWGEFGYEDWNVDLVETYAHVGPFVFEKEQYLTSLLNIK